MNGTGCILYVYPLRCCCNKAIHNFYYIVTWKPLEMYPLLKCLKPVSPKWKILAVHLNVQEVATIEKDCNYNAASDEALREVVTRWHGRTTRSKRTWKTLCDAALEEDDHTLKEYIDKNQLSCKYLNLNFHIAFPPDR